MSKRYTEKELIQRLREVRILTEIGRIRRKRPETNELFEGLAGEALACLSHADWEDHIRRIENILVVIKERIRRFWEEQHESELDKLVRKAKKEVDSHVG